VSTAGRETPIPATGCTAVGRAEPSARPGLVCVGDIDSVAVGSLRRVMVSSSHVCLVRTADDEIFALDDACSHEGGTLSEGEVWGAVLECPEHYARFDLRTGAALNLPATEPVRTHTVQVHDGRIWIEP
jgi:3-phenylpropionate/trans-cinnamate dioxygenase ferredoxin subunit